MASGIAGSGQARRAASIGAAAAAAAGWAEQRRPADADRPAAVRRQRALRQPRVQRHAAACVRKQDASFRDQPRGGADAYTHTASCLECCVNLVLAAQQHAACSDHCILASSRLAVQHDLTYARPADPQRLPSRAGRWRCCCGRR